MSGKVLEFERPIVELESKIRELKTLSGSVDMAGEIARLEEKAAVLQKERFAALTPWEQLQLAKHPDRPYTLDYIGELLTDFVELRGDRLFGDDPAIVAGLARFGDEPIVVMGQQKGRNTKENLYRNFGMARPEGYRKAQRLMRMAEQFGLSVLCFIDTAGAYPGIDAEERGQAEAIATCLELMAGLKVPTISVVIGEGGSGGALAIGVTDRILMLEHSVYSVISPRGCASILWKDADAERTAAEQLRMTAQDLVSLGVCDEIVREAPGGAHRGLTTTAQALQVALRRHFDELRALSCEARRDQRYAKFRRIGHLETVTQAQA
ncbi:acetyl-CoA carboxylase carboxyltransferase subunit alpha [Nannocystis sp.]|uniref:acetyl-CoA carboxylase carboxyltransferase subunit alpha n=1 Tax=Nannocystis sp. TaxID=1962667 RepID=UPI0024225B28|nr:acetyl-CoA carboxylase carboxyltransferase subunit alpha [Nannocystis sp.]MBK9756330.1 acetyl-CoA carboxylase carboxyltransferase subunit alpha [Nannocystis sp.]